MLEAVEAVCNARKDMTANILDMVASLIDKSLLYQHEQLNGEPRLFMLETIREYGLEALAASEEREALRHAHAIYYLRLAEEARPALEGPQQAVWLERLEQERDNLRAVMQWSLEQREVGQSTEMALRLGKALEHFWTAHGHYREGQTFLEQALAESEEVLTSVRAQALSAAARLLLDQCDLDQTEVLCEKSLALSQQLGDTRNSACSLYLLGAVAARRGNLTTARSLIEQGVSLYREIGDKGMIGYLLGSLANKLVRQGEYTRGHALLEESLALGREAGHKRGIAHSLLELAKLLFVSRSEGTIVHSLLEEGLVLYRELGDKHGIASYFSLAGQLALSQGDATMAYSLLEESLRLYREGQDRWDIAESLSFLAKVVTVQGDYVAARALYEESLALNREIGNKDIATCLEGLASVVAAQGELVRAARLWGTAESLRDAMGIPIPPVYRADYERSVSAALTQLGEQAFAAAWAEGCSVSPEQALAAQERETMSEAVRVSHPPLSLTHFRSAKRSATRRKPRQDIRALRHF
jgi:tetratricopeptide (TPR) repeat protein